MTLIDRIRRHLRQQGVAWTARSALDFATHHPRRALAELVEFADPVGRPDLTFDDVGPGDRLDLGCGMNPKPGYLGVDADAPAGAIQHDLTEPFPLESGVVSEIVCEHVVEHFDREDVVPFLDECRRVLRDDGIMRLAVPDFGSPGDLRARVGHGDDHPDHRYVTTVRTLAADVERSTFSRFRPRQYWLDGAFTYEPLTDPPPISRTPDALDAPFEVAVENSSLIVDLRP